MWFKQWAAKNTPFYSFTPDTMPKKLGANWFMPLGSGVSDGFWKASDEQLIKDFVEVPELNTVLNWKARAFSSGVYSVTTEDGKPAPMSNPLQRLIHNPNYFQSQREFLRQTNLFHNILGNEFIYLNKPVGFKATNAKSLISLPPQYITLTSDSKVKYWDLVEIPEVKMTLKVDGTVHNIVYDDVIHLNDNNVSTKPGSFLKGISKLQALRPNIRNIRAAYEARNVLIENRGALGILSNVGKDVAGTTPLEDTEKKDLQRQLSQYGLTKSQYQYIITSMPLQWQQMSIDADKLQLFEEIEKDFVAICDVMGIPSGLFLANQTFENKNASEKAAYQNTIIPDAEEWVQAVNKRFAMDGAFQLRVTFDHLPIFQEDIKQRSQALTWMVNALSKALADGAITIEEYQAQLNDLLK